MKRTLLDRMVGIKAKKPTSADDIFSRGNMGGIQGKCRACGRTTAVTGAPRYQICHRCRTIGVRID